MTPRLFTVAVLFATVAGALLRLPALSRESLSLDELSTLAAITQASWGGLVEALARDVQPPLYHLLMRPWTFVVGLGDGRVRFPSALAGTLSIPLAAMLGRRLFGPLAGVAGAALLAVAPLGVALSRDASPHALFLLLSVAATWALTRAWEPDRRFRDVVVYGLLCALVVWTHGFGLYLLAGHALWLGLELVAGALPWSRVKAWVWALLAGAVALFPWTTLLSIQASGGAPRVRLEPPAADSLGPLWIELSGGAGPAGVLLLGVGLALGRSRREARGATLLAASITGLILVPQLVSWLAVPVLRAGSLLPLLAVITLVAGAGLVSIRPARAGLALLGLCVAALALTAGRGSFGPPHKAQWREAAALVKAQWKAGDLAVADHPALWRHYLPEGMEVLEPPRDLAEGEARGWIRQQKPGAHRVWTLHGDLEAPFPVEDSLEQGRLRLIEAAPPGTRVRLIDISAMPIALSGLEMPSPSMRDANGLHFWWDAAVRSTPIIPPGEKGCSIEVTGRSELAAGVPAKLALRFLPAGREAIESQVELPGEKGTVRGQPFVEVMPAPVQVEVAFINDGVEAGPDGKPQDRNAHLEAITVRCER